MHSATSVILSHVSGGIAGVFRFAYRVYKTDAQQAQLSWPDGRPGRDVGRPLLCYSTSIGAETVGQVHHGEHIVGSSHDVDSEGVR